jgi:hypothetical protein
MGIKMSEKDPLSLMEVSRNEFAMDIIQNIIPQKSSDKIITELLNSHLVIKTLSKFTIQSTENYL